jgi:biopolymer transport protein ExbD
MERRSVTRPFLIGGLLAMWLCGLSGSEPCQIGKGSAQGKKGPAIPLPKAQNGRADSDINNRSFVVAIASEGEFYLGRERVKKEDLPRTIRDFFLDTPAIEQKIYIKSGEALKFGALREVLNIIRQVGFEHIEFVVESKKSTGNAAVFVAYIFDGPGVKHDPADQIALPPPPQRPSAKQPPQQPPPPPPPPPSGAVFRVRKAPEPPLGRNPIVVEVKSEVSGPGPTIAVNTKTMPLSGLRAFVSARLAAVGPNDDLPRVFMKPSRDLVYSDFIAVMDEIAGGATDAVWLLIDDVEVPRDMSRVPRRPR